MIIAFCAVLGALGAGCSDSGSDETHNMRGEWEVAEGDRDDIAYRCRAHVAPGVLTYSLDGDVLTLLSDLEPNPLVLRREGSGGGLYDRWFMHEIDDGVLEGRMFLVLERESITFRYECTGLNGKSAVAEATSRAIYTDSTIEILDEVEDQVSF